MSDTCGVRHHAVMSEASLELLAPREDVWKFLAEPYHLPDWWPGITGVEPDLRGFAAGARWKVHGTKRNVFAGRRSVETMLLVREIDLYERWSFHILEPKRDAEVRLRATGNAKIAVRRLYDLVQTAARL